MIALLSTLIIYYLSLEIGRAIFSLKVRLAVHVPSSMYLGWINIANISKLAVALTATVWNG